MNMIFNIIFSSSDKNIVYSFIGIHLNSNSSFIQKSNYYNFSHLKRSQELHMVNEEVSLHHIEYSFLLKFVLWYILINIFFFLRRPRTEDPGAEEGWVKYVSWFIILKMHMVIGLLSEPGIVRANQWK